MTTTTCQNGHKPNTQAFESLNVNALYDVLADILSEKHGAKIRYTIKEREAAASRQ